MWVAPVVAASAVGDCLGLLHQLTSGDRPPVPAMLLVGVLALATFAALPGLLRGETRAWWTAVTTRAVDVLLLVGAAAAGQVLGEETAHVAAAVGQFTLSLPALVLLVTCRGRLLSRGMARPTTMSSSV